MLVDIAPLGLSPYEAWCRWFKATAEQRGLAGKDIRFEKTSEVGIMLLR